MNFEKYIEKQNEWSLETFGPGQRDAGIIDHIKKELIEIEQAPGDLEEWMDIVILALNGASRNGYSPIEVCSMLEYKQDKNINKRQWPDWKTVDHDKAIEHIRN